MGSVAVARSQVETKEKVPGFISDISSIFTPDIPAPGAGPRHGGSEAHPEGAADPGARLRAGHAAPGHHQAEARRHEGGRQPVLSRGTILEILGTGHYNKHHKLTIHASIRMLGLC